MVRLTSTPIFVKIGQKMWLLQQLEISQKEGVCVKKGYDIYIDTVISRFTVLVGGMGKCTVYRDAR